MADQVQKPTQESVAAAEEEVVVLTDVPQAEKTAIPTPPPAVAPVPDAEEPMKPKPAEEAVTVDTELSKPDADEKIPPSFKEESTKVADLPDPEKKAVEELKQLIREALNKHEFTVSAPSVPPPAAAAKDEEAEKPAAAAVEEEEKKPEAAAAAVDVSEEPSKALEPAEIVAETKDVEVAEKEKIAPPPPQVTVAEEVAEPGVVTVKIEEKEAAETETLDDDGAKTVEAIKETIVAVSSSVPPEKENVAAPAPEAESKKAELEVPLQPEEVSIWGIPLLADERSDVILLKFLRARDFKVKDAFTMIKNTVRWRKEFGIDELVQEDLGNDLEKVVFMQGFDKEGHPVCYNVYGEFRNKELYQKTFSDEEKRQKFLRWRIQFLEKSIQKLDFTPGGISTMVQINDLKNSPGPGKWELRTATKQALQLLQDNYPEFVAKQVFINVPWWYLAVNRMISPFLTQRTKSKFVFAGPSKSADTLFSYIAAEQVPVKYGGLGKDGEFDTADVVTEITVKPAAKHTVEFPVTETCLLAWEVRVVGWDVSYGAEFVPNAEESYTVIIQKARKIAATEEPVVCNSFKIGEPGKVVLTIDNITSKKKKLLYRLKTKPTSD